MAGRIHEDGQDCEAPTPGASCVISADILANVQRDVQAILVCLKGDQTLGHRGLVRRMDEHDIKHATLRDKVDDIDEKVDRKFILWGGIVTGAWAVLSLFWQRVFK